MMKKKYVLYVHVYCIDEKKSNFRGKCWTCIHPHNMITYQCTMSLRENSLHPVPPLHKACATHPILLTHLKLALGQRGVEQAPVEVGAAGGQLQQQVGGVVQEVRLCPLRIQHGKQLGETGKGF